MLAVLVAFVVALVLFGLGWALLSPAGGLEPLPPDVADVGLPPDRPMTPADVDGVGLALAFRGYRMADVDATLDRLRDEIALRDAEIARLSAPTEETSPEPETSPTPEAAPEPSDSMAQSD